MNSTSVLFQCWASLKFHPIIFLLKKGENIKTKNKTSKEGFLCGYVRYFGMQVDIIFRREKF